MPFARPTLSALRTQAYAAFLANLPGADSALRRANVRVSAETMAGLTEGEYGYLDWMVYNVLLPTDATDEYLDRWGAIKGVTRMGPNAASGSVTIAGSTNGSDIPAGTILQLAPGITYQTLADQAVSGGGATLQIQAILPDQSADGSQWNVDAGGVLSFVTAIAGVNGSATVVADITNGTAPEDDDAYRVPVLLALRRPPQGGDQNDYLEWALDVPGITRAWPIANGMGSGTVLVYFMMDSIEAAHGGFPQGGAGVAAAEPRAAPATGDQLAAANAVFPLRPVTALVYWAAPIAAPQNFTVRNVSGGQLAAVEAAIGGVIAAEGAADGSVLSLADIQAAVRLVVPNGLVVSPTADITAGIGYLPTLGTVTLE